jgi:hypothetical protein
LVFYAVAAMRANSRERWDFNKGDGQIVNSPKPDNSGRNARIIELARQGKVHAEIARELGPVAARSMASFVERETPDCSQAQNV